jgi:soluble lytic murein transglycosylase-like protein
MSIDALTNPAGPNDSSAIELKRSSSLEGEKKRLFKAAKEMESLFLYQILKAMRSTVPKTDEENRLGLGGGMGKDVYTQMFDQELAMKMAGLGDKSLAATLYGSLEKVLEKQHAPASETPSVIKEVFPPRQYLEIKEPNTRTDDISRFDGIIDRISEKYRLSPEFLKAVIKTESGGDATAVSRAGAKGLMQLMDTTAADMGIQDVFDVEQNIEGGAKYLRQLLDRFGNLEKALAAYNAGPEAVEKYGGLPPYPETRKYVKAILSEIVRKQ